MTKNSWGMIPIKEASNGTYVSDEEYTPLYKNKQFENKIIQ